MRSITRSGVVILAAFLLATGLVATGARAETIRFGAILPLTGPGAMIGTQQMRGIQFAIDKANAAGGVHGNKIEVLFEDNQAKPDQSILSFNKLVDLQKVPLIFTAYSGPSLAMAPLATRKKILLINAGAQADKLATASPYLVNTLPTIGDEIKVLSRYLVGEGKKQGAILYENDAAGISGRDDFEKYFPQAGGTILSQEPAQFGQTDYRPALLKLADAKPQVMLVSITAGLLQMAQQYRQLGLKFTVAGTTFFADPVTIADPTSEGFVHTQVRIDAPPDLAAAFRAKFGVDMEFFVRQYYNATQIVLAVTDKLLSEGKPLTGQNMHDALFAIRKFQGLIPLQFNSNTATVPLDIDMMQGGKDVTIKQTSTD
ncbi:ABC transporter substrate-binding protein [Rhodopila sp.]|uniref:ABC transporter substrate-binding protein n=1 Tax=Rhodopila sp. TaxID=2480087 RepID=UPI003D0AFB54